MKNSQSATGGHLRSFTAYMTPSQKQEISTTQQEEHIFVSSGHFTSCLPDYKRARVLPSWRQCVILHLNDSVDQGCDRHPPTLPCPLLRKWGPSSQAGEDKNTSDRIWRLPLRQQIADVRHEDVQHQRHCGTSAGKEEVKHGRVGEFYLIQDVQLAHRSINTWPSTPISHSFRAEEFQNEIRDSHQILFENMNTNSGAPPSRPPLL